METTILLLLTLLFVKHFVVDFPLQVPYQWMNKGTYGHPGGILHSTYHALATYLILLFFVDVVAACYLSLAEGVLHYHIDWAKLPTFPRSGYPKGQKYLPALRSY